MLVLQGDRPNDANGSVDMVNPQPPAVEPDKEPTTRDCTIHLHKHMQKVPKSTDDMMPDVAITVTSPQIVFCCPPCFRNLHMT